MGPRNLTFFLAGAVLLAQPASAQTTTRVSVSTGGGQGNNNSFRSSISADGRLVAFYSEATNLVAGDTNGRGDIFVHDRQTGETTRVSVATGGGQGNNHSGEPSISADGRFVAFSSDASNLVEEDTNGRADVFVHDRQTGQTRLVSINALKEQGNDRSLRPSISADGRFVAFESLASNLVAGDFNLAWDIFVHDRQTGGTTRVSVATGGAQGNSSSGGPSISADGRFVAFFSLASNLVAGDTNGLGDIFVRDRQTGVTSRISVATGGAQANNNSGGPSISADGRFVAFLSIASNLVAGDTNGLGDIFVRDRQTGETTRVSVATGGAQGNMDCGTGVISADGLNVAFESNATNLVAGDTNGTRDIFIHDRQTGETTRVSVATGGAQANNTSSGFPSISSDGRFVAFESDASNLVPNDTNGVYDIFVHERASPPPPECPGDANGDGMVTFSDITSVLENWGADYSPGTGPGDANRDGVVSFSDVTSVLENWGAECS